MSVNRCEKGHFYDADIYAACPECETEFIKARIPEKFKALGAVSILGRGSVSTVFKIDGTTPYALKVIRCKKNSSKEKLTINELHIMEMLRNLKHSIQLIDYVIVDDCDERIFFLLEDFHVPMKEFLSGKTLYASEAVQIVIGICNALLECRNHGVLHLDVQPRNIYIDSIDSVTVGDFSSSLSIIDALNNTTARGTKAYMAPEVYQSGKCSEQSDIYSTGLILYYLLNNSTLPFMAVDTPELAIYKRLAATPFPFDGSNTSSVVARINKIISKACSFFTVDRYRCIEDFIDDLNALQFGKTDDFIAVGNASSQPDNDNGLSTQYNSYNDISLTVMLHQDGNSVVNIDSSNTENQASEFSADSIELTTAIDSSPFSEKTHEGRIPNSGINYCSLCNRKLPQEAKFCPSCGTIATRYKECIDIKKVEFSAIAPKELAKGNRSIITIIMYEESHRDVVDRKIKENNNAVQESRSGIINVKNNALIEVTLSSPDIFIDDQNATGTWVEGHLDFSFLVSIPKDYTKDDVVFNADVHINSVIATKLRFIVRCSSPSEQQHPSVQRKDIQSAFVSYSSKDRSAVATIIQGMKITRPELDIFFDVLSLRSGDDWENRLKNEIKKRDVLFLCWSRNARKSKWVDREWRYALEQNGEAGIEPIPVEPPEICPPPAELMHKHFNDSLIYIINAKNNK